MRNTEEAILNIFKNNASKELNTEFLVKEAYPEEYSAIERELENDDKKIVNSAKRQKFQFHRKILYYINKLVDEKILVVSRTADKGEKYFALQADEGEIIISKGHKKVIITKPTITTTYTEQYESKEVMKRYDEDTWVGRFNSILLECPKKYDTTRIQDIMMECSANVNDTLALNDFENMINTNSEKTLKEFLEWMVKDTEKSDKTISLIINAAQAGGNMEYFIDQYAELNPRKINIVFNISNKDLQRCSKMLIHVIERFSESKIKINFKNDDLSASPFFKGRAGIYNFDDNDWEVYSKRFRGSMIGISCSQSQIAININRFFEVYKTESEFREAILSAAKTLLIIDNAQRRKSNEYFKNINDLNSPYQAEFYRFSRNYIRFWNYDWHKSMHENDTIFSLIKSSKELTDNFCHTEETIYKSCGIPIRFRIAFSSAFRNFDQKFMGERDYKKMTVKKAEDYYTGEIKEFLQAREKMFEIFDGGDRLRIFRTSDFKPADIIHEWGILLNAYKIPFFTYDFSGLKGTVKLTNFM